MSYSRSQDLNISDSCEFYLSKEKSFATNNMKSAEWRNGNALKEWHMIWSLYLLYQITKLFFVILCIVLSLPSYSYHVLPRKSHRAMRRRWLRGLSSRLSLSRDVSYLLELKTKSRSLFYRVCFKNKHWETKQTKYKVQYAVDISCSTPNLMTVVDTNQ